jgi:hypothetical protein
MAAAAMHCCCSPALRHLPEQQASRCCNDSDHNNGKRGVAGVEVRAASTFDFDRATCHVEVAWDDAAGTLNNLYIVAKQHDSMLALCGALAAAAAALANVPKHLLHKL